MTEFRTSFELSSAPTEVWEALVALQSEAGNLQVEPHRWWLPGFAGTGTEIDVDPGRQLVVSKDDWPCAGTTIALTIEHVESGSRISVVQSGFDEGWVARAGESFWIIADLIAADLRLFFETGVLGGRHARPWVPLGCEVRTARGGVEVVDVAIGTWAERAGLRPGDLLVTLGGAPLLDARDAVTVQRIVEVGTDLSTTWARDGKLHEATATV